MSPFCLLAEENEDIYPGPRRGQLQKQSSQFPWFVCPRGVLSSLFPEVAVRLERGCSSLLLAEFSVLKSLCSWKVDSSTVSQSGHPKVKNQNLPVKRLQMETAALRMQSSLAQLYTCMWRKCLFIQPHMQADLHTENKRKKNNNVKVSSPLCLTTHSVIWHTWGQMLFHLYF